MSEIFGFAIGYVNGLAWPFLVLRAPQKWLPKCCHNRNSLLSFICWCSWCSISIFACAEATLVVVKFITPDITNFKEEIGKYIGLGIAVGIVMFPMSKSIASKVLSGREK